MSGRKVAFGAAASSAVNIMKVGLQFLMLPVMARLLGPSEFGLYALAIPTIGLVMLLADGGLGASLAREDETSTVVWSSAFWALTIMGIVLAIATMGVGFILGQVSHQPRLPGLIGLLSISLIFLSLSVAPIARLTRRKELGLTAGAEFAAVVVGSIIAVVMAWNGGGAWSLAVQYVSTFAVRAILLNAMAFQLPTLQLDFKAIHPHLISGALFVGSRLFDFGGRIVENLLIDRMFGTAILGSYTFANQMARFSTESLGNVSWAALYTQSLTSEPAKIIILHRQLSRLLGLLLFPTMFIAAAAAPQLIDLMLGPKWADLSFFLRVLLPLYAFTTVCAQTLPISLARNRFDIQFWCSAGICVGRVLALMAGYWVGLNGAVFLLAVVTFIYGVAVLVLPAESTGCRPLPVVMAIIRPAIAALIAALAFLVLIQAFPPGLFSTIANLFAALLIYLATLFAIDRKHLTDDWTAARKLWQLKSELKPT